MKTAILFLLLSASLSAAPFRLNKSALDNRRVPFLPHTGTAPMSNYLAMNVGFAPFDELRKQIEQRIGFKLKQRGEAHITTVTPVEFDSALHKHLSMGDINTLAARRSIQSTALSIVCVGRGRAILNGKEAHTYYAVVNAPGLVRIREDIAAVFQRRGGGKTEFESRRFYPHITLGFTERDLHESDNVFKDSRTCWEKVQIR